MILRDQRQLEFTIAEQKQLLDKVASKQKSSPQPLNSLEKESRLLHSFQVGTFLEALPVETHPTKLLLSFISSI